MTAASVVLVGGGLANCLLALRLRALRPDVSLTLVEGADRLGGNHTWSFHGTDVSPEILAWLRPLASYSWPHYDVKFPGRERRLRGQLSLADVRAPARRRDDCARRPGPAECAGRGRRARPGDPGRRRAAGGGPGRGRPRPALVVRSRRHAALPEVPGPARAAAGAPRPHGPAAHGRHRVPGAGLPVRLSPAVHGHRRADRGHLLQRHRRARHRRSSASTSRATPPAGAGRCRRCSGRRTACCPSCSTATWRRSGPWPTPCRAPACAPACFTTPPATPCPRPPRWRTRCRACPTCTAGRSRPGSATGSGAAGASSASSAC